MNWQYKTICRGPTSLLAQLVTEFPKVDIDEYISFYSLRKFQEIPNKIHNFTTEQIYVHSKLLIGSYHTREPQKKEEIHGNKKKKN